MANYGPPDGPPPWAGRRSDDAYGAGPDPQRLPEWGEPRAGRSDRHPGGYASTELHPPTVPYQQGGPAAYLGDPTPPRPKRRVPLVPVLAVLAVVVLGAGVLWYLSGREEPTSPVAGTAAPAVTVDPASPGPGVPAPTTPAPASSSDPRFVAAGQCVRNDGPAGGRPRLLIAECAPRTYEVLRRFDGETSGERDAEAKCGQVAGYTDWFFYDSELDSLDFVLCLRKR